MTAHQVIDSDAMPPVYVAPANSPAMCEVGSGEDWTRCSRADLREWAEAILHTLAETADEGER